MMPRTGRKKRRPDTTELRIRVDTSPTTHPYGRPKTAIPTKQNPATPMAESDKRRMIPTINRGKVYHASRGYDSMRVRTLAKGCIK